VLVVAAPCKSVTSITTGCLNIPSLLSKVLRLAVGIWDAVISPVLGLPIPKLPAVYAEAVVKVKVWLSVAVIVPTIVPTGSCSSIVKN